jgi:NADPH2:quinone reductase
LLQTGGYAEEIVTQQKNVVKLPEGMDGADACALLCAYGTAHHALKQRAVLRPGEKLVVLGAAGSTGLAAIQIGKAMGADVVAVASSEEKRALARANGADAAVDYDDLKDAIKRETGGGADVVFDPVGGDATDPAFRSLAWNGRHLVVGFPGGIAALRTNLPLLKGASLIGVDVRQFGLFEPERSQANRDTVFALAAEGKFRPAIARTYKLEDFRAAMKDAAAGKSAGRIVLTMD